MNEINVSPSEWEVMRVIWTTNPITSKEVSEILKEKKGWKLSTTKTLIGRLVKKGMITSEAKGRKYEYSPIVSQEERIGDMIEEFLNQVCATKIGEIIKIMLENNELSLSDIEELEKILQAKKIAAPEEVVCDCIPGQCDCMNQ